MADLGLWLATVWATIGRTIGDLAAATIGLPLAIGVESGKLRLAADNYVVFSCIIHQKTDSDLARYCQFSPFVFKNKKPQLTENWRLDMLWFYFSDKNGIIGVLQLLE